MIKFTSTILAHSSVPSKADHWPLLSTLLTPCLQAVISCRQSIKIGTSGFHKLGLLVLPMGYICSILNRILKIGIHDLQWCNCTIQIHFVINSKSLRFLPQWISVSKLVCDFDKVEYSFSLSCQYIFIVSIDMYCYFSKKFVLLLFSYLEQLLRLIIFVFISRIVFKFNRIHCTSFARTRNPYTF